MSSPSQNRYDRMTWNEYYELMVERHGKEIAATIVDWSTSEAGEYAKVLGRQRQRNRRKVMQRRTST